MLARFALPGSIGNVNLPENSSLAATTRQRGLLLASLCLGMGIALVPRVTAERELAAGTLVEVELTDIAPIHRPISLIVRKNRKRSRTVEAFVEMVAREYSAQPVASR